MPISLTLNLIRLNVGILSFSSKFAFILGEGFLWLNIYSSFLSFGHSFLKFTQLFFTYIFQFPIKQLFLNLNACTVSLWHNKHKILTYFQKLIESLNSGYKDDLSDRRRTVSRVSRVEDYSLNKVRAHSLKGGPMVVQFFLEFMLGTYLSKLERLKCQIHPWCMYFCFTNHLETSKHSA